MPGVPKPGIDRYQYINYPEILDSQPSIGQALGFGKVPIPPELVDLNSFCAIDPPAIPQITLSDMLIQGGGYLKSKEYARAVKWYDFCELPGEPPFQGGQCSGIEYLVSLTLRNEYGQIAASDYRLITSGGIKGAVYGSAYGQPGMGLAVATSPSNPNGTYLLIQGVASAYLPQVNWVQRRDGQPDNCGNPPNAPGTTPPRPNTPPVAPGVPSAPTNNNNDAVTFAQLASSLAAQSAFDFAANKALATATAAAQTAANNAAHQATQSALSTAINNARDNIKDAIQSANSKVWTLTFCTVSITTIPANIKQQRSSNGTPVYYLGWVQFKRQNGQNFERMRIESASCVFICPCPGTFEVAYNLYPGVVGTVSSFTRDIAKDGSIS